RRRAHRAVRRRRHRRGGQAGRRGRASQPGLDGPHGAGRAGRARRPRVVLGLVSGATGVVVVAKPEHAYSVLKRAFKERTVEKRYHAVVQGHPDPSRGTVDAPIDRHPKHDHKWAVVAGGRPSVTHYDTIEAFRAASLLDVRLE